MSDWSGFSPGLREDPVEFYLYQWLTVLDIQSGSWLEAQVINVNESSFQIHYRGYTSRFDEWIPFATAQSRCRALQFPPRRGELLSRAMLSSRGTRVDVEDSVGKWYIAEILDVKPDWGPVGMVRITFLEWGPKYDTWLDMDSVRITAPHTVIAAANNQQVQSNSEVNSGNSGEFNSTYNRDRHEGHEGNARSNDCEVEFERVIRARFNGSIIRMAGDGNCLFRAVAHQVYSDASHHKMVRSSVVDYMESQKEYFSNFVVGDFNEYLTAMRADGCWGDHVEIQAMSEVYNRPIQVYSYSDVPLKTYSPTSTQDPIRLSYHRRSHYNSIITPLYWKQGIPEPGLCEAAAMCQTQDRSCRQDFQLLDYEVLEESDPFAVEQCMELGFTREQSLAAYSLFNDESLSPQTVFEHMTNYLLSL